MKTTKYKFSKILKSAQKAGKRDGKNDLPKSDWDKNSIPFLTLLNRKYQEKIEANALSLYGQVRQFEDDKAAADQNVITSHAHMSLMKSHLDEAEKSVIELEAQVQGDKTDMPSAQPSKQKNLDSFRYWLLLGTCFIAELVVTIPALQFLLGERRSAAALLAIALGVITFIGAYVIGSTLKRRQDRATPQPTTDIVLISVIATILHLAIIAMGYVRANQSAPYAGNFVELPDQWKLEILWIFWTFLQLLAFYVAIGASYFHYSELMSKYTKAKRHRFARKVLYDRAEKRFSKQSAFRKSLEINWKPSLEKRIREIKQEENLLVAHYNQACAKYVDTNMHSRKQSIKGDHAAFTAPELELAELDIAAFTPNAESDFSVVENLVAGGVR